MRVYILRGRTWELAPYLPQEDSKRESVQSGRKREKQHHQLNKIIYRYEGKCQRKPLEGLRGVASGGRDGDLRLYMVGASFFIKAI